MARQSDINSHHEQKLNSISNFLMIKFTLTAYQKKNKKREREKKGIYFIKAFFFLPQFKSDCMQGRNGELELEQRRGREVAETNRLHLTAWLWLESQLSIFVLFVCLLSRNRSF